MQYRRLNKNSPRQAIAQKFPDAHTFQRSWTLQIILLGPKTANFWQGYLIRCTLRSLRGSDARSSGTRRERNELSLEVSLSQNSALILTARMVIYPTVEDSRGEGWTLRRPGPSFRILGEYVQGIIFKYLGRFLMIVYLKASCEYKIFGGKIISYFDTLKFIILSIWRNFFIFDRLKHFGDSIYD